MMNRSLNTTHTPEVTISALSADWRPLMAQIGGSDGLSRLASVESLPAFMPIGNRRRLKQFLKAYYSSVLAPIELPAIVEAHTHGSKGEARELIAADQRLAERAVPAAFAEASSRIGRIQLERLRPLKDLRIVERYLKAVEESQAAAWHTVVYGLILAFYSLPLRQGLQHYALNVMHGLAEEAGARLIMDEGPDTFVAQLNLPLAKDIEAALEHAGAALFSTT